jgi:thioredoxin 1
MHTRRRHLNLFFIGALGFFLGVVPACRAAGGFDDVPAKGMPTLVVLGTPACPPCIRMKPILEEMAERYKGKAAVVPIDILVHPDQAQRFKVKAIPVEIFFNAEGREMFRHLGYMDAQSIREQFRKMGLEP